MVTIRELEKLGIFENVYEDALDMSFGAKNPGMALIHVCVILLLKEILFEVTVHHFRDKLAQFIIFLLNSQYILTNS